LTTLKYYIRLPIRIRRYTNIDTIQDSTIHTYPVFWGNAAYKIKYTHINHIYTVT